MASDSPLEIILIVGTIAVLAIVFPMVAGSIADSNPDTQDATRVDQTVVLEGSTDWFVVGADAGYTGKDQTVRDSRGFAMRFTGASDSYLTADSDVALANNENWTVTTGVWINTSATESNMTILAAGDPNLYLLYDNTTAPANFSAVYVTTTDTYRANVSAPADVVNSPTVVMAEKQGENVTVYANTTAGETVNVSTSDGWGGSLTVSDRCHCDLDETRVFNESLTSAQRAALVNDPIIPLTNASDRTARIMYDAGSGTAVNMYWAPTSATANNASYVAGFGGNVLDESGALSLLVSSGDYHWRTDGPEIRAEGGGRLDGAPAAFVEYDRRGITDRALDEIADGYEMMGLVMIVLIAGAVMTIVMRFRS